MPLPSNSHPTSPFLFSCSVTNNEMKSSLAQQKKLKINNVPPPTMTGLNGMQGTPATQEGWMKVEKQKKDVRWCMILLPHLPSSNALVD